METPIQNEERKLVHDKIKKKVFELEKENYKQKTLSTNEVIKKIKRIVEEEVK